MGDCDKDYGNKSLGKGAGPNRLADRNPKRGRESNPGFALQQLLDDNPIYFRIDRAAEEEWRVLCKSERDQLAIDRKTGIIASDEELWRLQAEISMTWPNRRTPWLTARIAELEAAWAATGLKRDPRSDDFEMAMVPLDSGPETNIFKIGEFTVDFQPGYNNAAIQLSTQMKKSPVKIPPEQRDKLLKEFNDVWKVYKGRPMVKRMAVKQALMPKPASK